MYEMFNKNMFVVFILITLLLVACESASAPVSAPTLPAILSTQTLPEPTSVEGVTSTEKETDVLEEKKVTVLGGIHDRDRDRFLESIKVFEERTGIDVIYDGASRGFPQFVTMQLEDGTPADIIMFPQPGLMADLARRGHLLNLAPLIDNDQLMKDFSETWIDLGTVDGRLVGVWYRASVKSLVWYPVPEFEAAGYEVPQTWDEMLALSDKIVADGGTPWCIGMAHEPTASGWVGTDWVEDIMLRTAGAKKYDQWVAGDLKFDSPDVRRAFDLFSDILFDPNYVAGGKTAVTNTYFGDSPAPLFDDPPGCWLHRQANFITNFFPENVQGEIPQHVNAFYLPPIDGEQGSPVLGAGDIISITNDRPEVVAFLNFLASAEAAEFWAKEGGFISPNKSVPLTWYPDEITRTQAEILVEADVFRFDGSDLMPGEVGTGSFWIEMMKWVDGQDLETTLQAIDASWPD